MTRLPFLFLLLFLTACGSVPSTQTTPIIPPTPLISATQASCTNVTIAPTPGADAPSLFPPESGSDFVRGSATPALTIMTYVDYQDPRSKSFVDVTVRLLVEHPTDVRVVYRLLPLVGVNDKSELAARAVLAAEAQGKFWDMHDLLFAQQANWGALSAQDFAHWLTAQASGLGLDAAQFESDWNGDAVKARVQQMNEDAIKIGIPGVPLILINGQIYGGPRDHTSLNGILQLITLGERQFTNCPPLSVDPTRQYIATLHTSKGEVVIQLFADKAPVTVNSFLFLVQNGWYEGITFHRVIPQLFAQTGDPSGTGKGNPGYYVITEIDPALTFNKPGMVAMVNSGPDTSGSQFFITYAPAAQFDGQYTIFGQVLSGMEVLTALTPRDAQPGSETPPGDELLRVTVEER